MPLRPNPLVQEIKRLQAQLETAQQALRATLGPALLDLLLHGSWKYDRQLINLTPASAETARQARELVSRYQETDHHHEFCYQVKGYPIKGKLENGRVTFDIYSLADLTDLNVIRHKWQEDALTEVDDRIEHLRRVLKQEEGRRRRLLAKEPR